MRGDGVQRELLRDDWTTWTLGPVESRVEPRGVATCFSRDASITLYSPSRSAPAPPAALFFTASSHRFSFLSCFFLFSPTMNSTARRPARVPSLSIVLPHPPLPRRCSISKSPELVAATPRTPRSSCSSTPGLFKLDAVTSRTSTESRMSWNSSYDGLEDEMEWEWRQEQVMLLAKVSHLVYCCRGSSNIASSSLPDYGCFTFTHTNTF